MAKWTPFPHAGDYQFDAASVKKHWARLHGGDAEPCPKDAAALEAWALFHNGDFEKAAAAGLAAGGAGITAANKATSIYANYLEPKEKARLDLFMQVAERAQAQAAKEPDNANAASVCRKPVMNNYEFKTCCPGRAREMPRRQPK